MNDTVRQLKLKISGITKIKNDVFLISFSSAYLSRTAQPGNFLHVKVNGVILRRPFSIHKIEQNKIFVLFKVKGRGTKALSGYKKGRQLDVIGPLGKGFSLPKPGKKRTHILAAGGIGVAPLMFLARRLTQSSGLKAPGSRVVLLGAKSKNDLLCENEFKQLGFQVKIATDDGSAGYKGTVSHLLTKELRKAKGLTAIYACGPEAMFKSMQPLIKKHRAIDCQVSFEQFMGCGLGVCCACVIKTKQGYKKVCKDGPVFNIRDIW